MLLLQCMLDIPCSVKVCNLDDKDHHWAYLHFLKKHLSSTAHVLCCGLKLKFDLNFLNQFDFYLTLPHINDINLKEKTNKMVGNILNQS